MRRYPQQAAPQVQSTLAKLSLCRTSALGARWYRCGNCQQECVLYNSCGDRNCPECSGAKRSDWIDRHDLLLLDGVPYFQVVFTLPSELSSLALGNRRAIYNLLFTSAWAALKETVEAEQGYDPAALMVLHTWNQQLQPHAHVHAIVPGGGPALDGSGWVRSRRPGQSADREAADYLVDAVALRRTFRRQFLTGLNRLYERGELKLAGSMAALADAEHWQDMAAQLQTKEWVSYIEPPPRQRDGQPCSAEQVMKYLARYLTGGPISEHRILAADAEQVTFWAREGKVTGGSREQVPVTLSALEFTRRWCLHILPPGFTKTRAYGGWHNRRRAAYLERSAILLENAPLPSTAEAFSPARWEGASSEGSGPLCPSCAGPIELLRAEDKPPWRQLLHSDCCPHWYRRHPPPSPAPLNLQLATADG